MLLVIGMIIGEQSFTSQGKYKNMRTLGLIMGVTLPMHYQEIQIPNTLGKFLSGLT